MRRRTTPASRSSEARSRRSGRTSSGGRQRDPDPHADRQRRHRRRALRRAVRAVECRLRRRLRSGVGKPLITLHPEQHDHALKEVDRAALVVAREPEQVVAVLSLRDRRRAPQAEPTRKHKPRIAASTGRQVTPPAPVGPACRRSFRVPSWREPRCGCWSWSSWAAVARVPSRRSRAAAADPRPRASRAAHPGGRRRGGRWRARRLGGRERVGGLRRRVPVRRDTRFAIGSVTKPFVAGLVVQLAATGVLGLDDPLSRWVPRFPGARRITLRELLDQTSGLDDYVGDGRFLAAERRRGPEFEWAPRELLRYVPSPLAAPASAGTTPTPTTCCSGWSSSGRLTGASDRSCRMRSSFSRRSVRPATWRSATSTGAQATTTRSSPAGRPRAARGRRATCWRAPATSRASATPCCARRPAEG